MSDDTRIAKMAMAALLERATRSSELEDKTPEEIAAELKERYNALTGIKHEFEAGQLVQFKKGFQNGKYAGPFVVTEILDEPIIAGDNYCHADFRRPLDMVAGVIDSDGDFLEFHFDSRRLEPYEASA